MLSCEAKKDFKFVFETSKKYCGYCKKHLIFMFILKENSHYYHL